MIRRRKVLLEKIYLFPQTLSVICHQGKMIVVNKNGFSWLVLNEKEFSVFNYLRRGFSVGEVLKSSVDKNDVVSVITQIEAKNFENPVISKALSARRVQIHLTNGCNLRCRHCYMFSGSPAEGELTVKEWKVVLEKLIENSCNNVTFTGGEITTLKGFEELVVFAKKLGFSIRILTNGLLWTEEMIKKMAPCFDSVQVSIDGYDSETYKQVRIVDGFKRALDCVKMFVKYGVSTSIATTPVFNLSEDWIHKYIEFAKRVRKEIPNCSIDVSEDLMDGRETTGITQDDVFYSMIAKKIRAELNPERDVGALTQDHLQNNVKENCGIGNAVTISATGDVSWCARLSDAKSSYNVRTASFKEIFEMSEIVSKKTSVDFCTPCRDCDLKYICGGPCRLKYSSSMRKSNLESSGTMLWEIACPKGQREIVLDSMIKANHLFFQ